MKYARIAIVAGLVCFGLLVVSVRWYADRSAAAVRRFDEAMKSLPRGYQPEDPGALFSDEEIQAMVNRLFTPKNDVANIENLRLVGARANPYLLTALNSEQTYAADKPIHDSAPYEATPFELICKLLRDTCPAEAVEPLTRYAPHRSKRFRKETAYLLGLIGTETCIEPFKKLLKDPNAEVREFAIDGVQEGLERDRRNDAFLESVFTQLQPGLIRRRTSWASRDSANRDVLLLLQINRERAAAAILSKECFSLSNTRLEDALEAMNKARYQIPHDRLLPLLRELEPYEEGGHYSHEYAAALVAYAIHPDSDSKAYLTKRLDAVESAIQNGALEGLGILQGVENAYFFLSDRRREVGWENLTPPQQNYLAVFEYDLALHDAGHWEYFHSDQGNHVMIALRAFEAIGADQNAELLREALALFGAEGPASDKNQRLIQNARGTSEHLQLLTKLDRRRSDLRENHYRLLDLYVLKNASHFRPQTKP